RARGAARLHLGGGLRGLDPTCQSRPGADPAGTSGGREDYRGVVLHGAWVVGRTVSATCCGVSLVGKPHDLRLDQPGLHASVCRGLACGVAASDAPYAQVALGGETEASSVFQ